MDYKMLADILVPDVKLTVEDYEKIYPERNLPDGAIVTRFAPSPTGFLHIGGLFASLFAERIAHQSGGAFYIRIEDTDKKREITGGVNNIIKSLYDFGVCFDEGPVSENEYKGSYGPYKQSARREIYRAYVKSLIKRGLAYPCFCSEEDINKIRIIQEENKVRPGYYGEWAVHRNLSIDEIMNNIEKGMPYVIRFKSPGNGEKRIVFNDLIKGRIELPENDQDIVILKTDGLPTYHFAHAVDDHLMRTTIVTRANEWLSSVPLHTQLFEALGFKVPCYAHIAPIQKIEGSSKRKLSKRKDPEISLGYYHKEGYTFTAVREYLLNLINSGFEDWRKVNIDNNYTDFPVEIGKMSISGPLFDLNKLTDISKNVISLMSSDEVYNLYLDWTKAYDRDMAERIIKNEEYTKKIFNIERNVGKPRKDFAKWQEIKTYIEYFYDDLFGISIESGYIFPEKFSIIEIKNIINEYVGIYDDKDDKVLWFDKIRTLTEKLGYAKDMKSYKKSPDKYKGNIADIAMIIRIALTNKANTPDLYEVMQVMGSDRVAQRLKNLQKL